MSKIIQDPDRIINALTKSFGEYNRHAIAQMFSSYISDVVIAVTAEDIAAQAIAWANSREDFPCEPIDIDVDGDRYVSVQNVLMQTLDIESAIKQIEEEQDINGASYSEIIEDALSSRYEDETLMQLVVNAVIRY
jgi:uncharacterized protein YejL (UPF0352 family)